MFTVGRLLDFISHGGLVLGIVCAWFAFALIVGAFIQFGMGDDDAECGIQSSDEGLAAKTVPTSSQLMGASVLKSSVG